MQSLTTNSDRPADASQRGQILLLLALAVHAAVVLSIVDSPRPIIWPLHNDTVHRIGPASDFYAVYHAGVNSRRGLSPYANNQDGVTPFYYPFRYLPGLGFIAQALTWIPPRQAYLLWIAVLESLLAALVVALRPRVPRGWSWPALASLLLVSSPYFLELYMGQFTFAAVAFCAIAVLAGRPWLFAAGTVLKGFPAIALPAFVRRPGERRAIVYTVVAWLAATVPFFLLRPDDFTRVVAVNLNPGGALDSGNYSSLMLVYLAASDLRLAPSDWAAAVGVLRGVVLAATAALVVVKNPPPLAGMCALLLAHFVTYQHIWEHSLSGVVVIGALLITLADLSRRDEWFIWACLIALALPTPFALFDTARDTSAGNPALAWPRWQWYLVVLPKALPTIGLFAWCVRRLISPVRSVRRPPSREASADRRGLGGGG